MLEFNVFNDPHQCEVWIAEQRTEVALVLCSLCSGTYRWRVQDELVNAGVIKALSDLFDSLIWDPKYRPDRLPLEERPHGGFLCALTRSKKKKQTQQ